MRKKQPFFCYNLQNEKKCKKEIENLTAMNVENVDIIAKGIHVSEEIKGE